MRSWILVCTCASLALVGCNDPEPGTDAGTDGDVAPMDAGSDDAGATDAGPRDASVDGGQDGGGGSPAVDAFARAISEETCRLYIECGSKFGAISEALHSLCHPSVDALFAEIEGLLAAGTAVFDPDAAERCLEGYRTATCADLTNPPPACLDVFVPTVAVGGTCSSNEECIDGVCESAGSCSGTCAARGGLGEACGGVGVDCQTDLICYMGTCEARHPEGGGCATDDHCEPGLRCGDANTCEALLADGQPCSSGFDCAGDAVCSAGACGSGQAEGEECETGFTATLLCEVGLRCDPVEETCVPLSLPGGACSADVNCPGSFWCDEGTCAPLPVAGESCAGSTRCLSGICDAGTCRLAGEGEACSPSSDLLGLPPSCESGLYCGPGDQCAPVLGEGDPCVSDASCGEGMECQSGDAGAVCAPECPAP